MEKISNTYEILKDLFSEAENGKIVIGDKNRGGLIYYARFFINSNGENNIRNSSCPVVNIPNNKLFVEKVDEYLNYARKFYSFDKDYYDFDNDKDFNKFLILCLLVNAGIGDFENIIDYIETRTQFFKNTHKQVIDKGKLFDYYVSVEINNNHANLETPFKFTPKFIDEDRGEEFILPSVLFGISEGNAYVYALQGKKGKQSGKVSKDLDRYLRKVNKDVDMKEIEGNVSPSALVSLTMFVSYLKEQGVNSIIAPAFLPLRYTAEKNAVYYKGKVKEKTNEEIKRDIDKRDLIQYNITDKFMHLFVRYCHHFDNSNYYFDEDNQRMIVSIEPQKSKTENIIYGFDK